MSKKSVGYYKPTSKPTSTSGGTKNSQYHKKEVEPLENSQSVTNDGVYLYNKDYQHYVVHVSKKPYDVYVGRFNPSMDPKTDFKWGNKFRVGVHGDRNTCVKKYRDWLFAPEQAKLFQQAKDELKGKILACYCSPMNCHGFVLSEVANSSVSNTVEDRENSKVSAVLPTTTSTVVEPVVQSTTTTTTTSGGGPVVSPKPAGLTWAQISSVHTPNQSLKPTSQTGATFSSTPSIESENDFPSMNSSGKFKK
ncbi:hypothetical protein DLAC_07427 [Tieghemostelium lacteum]|uniref:DUF4326 domain-containing protein n=1 Tax=Tieghemostelium lacteum TaxID=361077 RepID=A0A151ZCI2_TIELA|nr:hypothetical protein DLAC_07427 [Tieghemostelium lacteum]|eukprot:KYQ91650.1 hypothetical protein DLAC_07427 [Tieghemostelium lacteum]